MQLTPVLSEFIAFDIQYKVFICRECKHILTPTAISISRHLTENHPGRVPVVECDNLQNLLSQPAFHNAIAKLLPLADGSPIHDLLQVWPGFQCSECDMRTKNEQKANAHKNTEHPGGTIQKVHLQSWTVAWRPQWWIVAAGTTSTQQAQTLVVPAPLTPLQASLATWRNRLQAQQKILQATPSKDQLDPWQRQTRFLEVHIRSSHSMSELELFTQSSGVMWQDFPAIRESWRTIQARCMQSLSGIGHTSLMHWLQSPKENEPDIRALGYLGQPTLDRYWRRWEGIIYYILRTAPLSDGTFLRCSKGLEIKTGIQLNQAQAEATKEIRDALILEDGTSVTSGIMKLARAILCQKLVFEDVFTSPLTHYCAAIAINPRSGALRPAGDLTPAFAGLLFVNRVLFFELTAPLEAWPCLGLAARCDRNNDEVLHQFDMDRAKYLCQGSHTATATLLKHLATGMRFTKQHQHQASILWSEDNRTVTYESITLELDDITTLISNLVSIP